METHGCISFLSSIAVCFAAACVACVACVVCCFFVCLLLVTCRQLLTSCLSPIDIYLLHPLCQCVVYSVSRAKSVFIIADPLASEKDKDAVDMQVMLTALAISKSSPKTTHILAQVLLPESISTVRTAGAHVVVCESALKYSILANSFWSNGISAFISNLARSSDLDGSDYADGCDWELYTVPFSSSCIGCTFDVISRRLLREEFPRPLLIGIIQHEGAPSRVVVNPPHSYVVNGFDEAIVMAVDLRHAQEMMELNMINKLAVPDFADEYQVKSKYHHQNSKSHPPHHSRHPHRAAATTATTAYTVSPQKMTASRGASTLSAGRGGSSHTTVYTTTSRDTIQKIKKVIQSGLIKSQATRDVNALSDCTDFRNHIVVLGTANSAVNLVRHLCLCEADEDNKELLPPVVVLTLSSDTLEAEKAHQPKDVDVKYLNSVCAGLIHGVVGSVEDLMRSGATFASMVVLLSSRQIELEEGYHTDGMGIRTTLLLRSECKKRNLVEPYIVTELFNSANTLFVDATTWGGSNSKKESHYTLSPVFSEGKIYTNELNDTLLGMSYYVPRMAECLVQMIDGPSKLRHYAVPNEFVGRPYVEIVRYLQSHETTAVAVVSKGLAVGVEQRLHDDLSLRTALTLWKMVLCKNCGGGGCKRQKEKTKHKNKKTSLQSQKSSIYSKQSWSRMEMMTLNESDFDDPLHQCVITCPPDNRLLAKNDKILVLRPFEESPSQLKLGQSSRNLFPSKKSGDKKANSGVNIERSGDDVKILDSGESKKDVIIITDDDKNNSKSSVLDDLLMELSDYDD